MTNFQLEPTQTDIPIYPRSLVGAFADPCSARKRQLFPILWTSVTLIRLENKSPNNLLYIQFETGDLDAKITKGQFIVKVQENIQKIITSQSDIVRGTLPSKMMNCAYAAVGFSELVDNELSIVVDGNSIIVSPKKSNNAVTINWFQFN